MMAQCILINFCCFLLFLPAAAGATDGKTALDVVRESNQEILGIFHRAETLTDEDVGEIYRIMERITDFRKMANRATEAVCAHAKQPECRELQSVFIELLQHTALTKAGRYRADRFEYLGIENSDNGQILVKSIAYFGDESVSFDYILEEEDLEKRWLITDYIVDGVDTVLNYRQQFKRIVAGKSLQELVNRLKKKNEQYRNAGSSNS